MIRESTENYLFHREGAKEYLTFPRLDQYEELCHLFTTRRGGVSEGCCTSWNFGAKSLDTEENVLRNYEILAEVMGTRTERMVTSQQTHTCNIRVVTKKDLGKGVTRQRDYTDVDGLLTDERNVAIITGHADCNAIFFFDPVKQVIGLAHSGWRGTLGGIGKVMLAKMENLYGCHPANILSGIGPSLCQDCFEVDEDVAQAFFAKTGDNRKFSYQRGSKHYIDLKGIIRRDLLESGLTEENFLDMGLCTKCNIDTFFSHRGHKGKRGIMAAAMMLK